MKKVACVSLAAAFALSASALGAPVLSVDSDILGMADTGNKTTLKVDLVYTHGPGDINLYHYDEEGNRVIYENEEELVIPLDPVSYTGSAVFDLGEDVDDSLIDSSQAVVRILDGNSYHANEFILNADKLDGQWQDGKYVYTLEEGDLLWNTWDYDTSLDYNSDREWSIMGGDGAGVYNFTFEVSGILYDGQEVEPVSFPVTVYIYGRTCTDLALSTEFVENTVDEAYVSGLAPSNEVQWKWFSENEESMEDGRPYMNDLYTDYFSIVWPEGSDASSITAEDVTVTLRSAYGDAYVLSEETAYGEHEISVWSSDSETVVAVTYQQWAFVPVYSTMEIAVDNGTLKAETLYDIASVAAYVVQTGGGGVTVDHTVTCFNYYGFENLTTETAANTSYTLSLEKEDGTWFYAEDAEGKGYLSRGIESTNAFGRTMVEAPEDAWKGDGTEKYHIEVIENVLFYETLMDHNEEKEVDGEVLSFTQNLSVNRDESQVYAAGASLAPGYNMHGTGVSKWAWTMRYQSGWTINSPKPAGLPYVAGAYGYGYEPGEKNPVYELEQSLLEQEAQSGPDGNGPKG